MNSLKETLKLRENILKKKNKISVLKYLTLQKKTENKNLDYLNQKNLSILCKNFKMAKTRNFCLLTGRNRSTYNKFRLSRICIRELAGSGILSGLKKSSW